MEQSANLQLPYIMPSQAQKHVTHNEAIRMLDSVVQLAVVDRDLSAPPVSPADGDRYLVAVGGSGAWTSKDGSVAAWQDGAWAFLAPKAGWLAWIADENRLMGFDGTAWVDAALHSVNPAPLVGVNAVADATNRLAVKSPATLFDEEAGDHRVKVNKAAAGGSATLVFQSGYSGRAELGLAGDDDWSVKVSADGAAWTDALKVDRATGRVSLPAALPLSDENQVVAQRHVRERLTTNRAYYVRTDGNDGNDGLSNAAGGAFLTLQGALNKVATIDFNGFTVTIQLANGTYTAGGVVPATVGQADVDDLIIQGNAAAPGSVIVNAPNSDCVLALAGTRVKVKDVELRTNGANASCLNALGGVIWFENIRFGTTVIHHVTAAYGGVVLAQGNYAITGGAFTHMSAALCGTIQIYGRTVTITGTPSIVNFAQAALLGNLHVGANAYSGSATGKRYDVSANSVINAAGGGASYFPGNSAGSAATGGLYL